MKLTKLLIVLLLTACANDNILTKKEMETQNKADSVVAGVLFDHELDDQASYNVSKSGSVTIKFTEDVAMKKYTKIVNILRSNASVDGVYAEQSGQEVCAPGKGTVFKSK